jgi:hypothetical protein
LLVMRFFTFVPTLPCAKGDAQSDQTTIAPAKRFFCGDSPVLHSIIRRATSMCFLGNAHELLGYLARDGLTPLALGTTILSLRPRRRMYSSGRGGLCGNRREAQKLPGDFFDRLRKRMASTPAFLSRPGSFAFCRPYGDKQQSHLPMPEEVRPRRDNAVTKPLDSRATTRAILRAVDIPAKLFENGHAEAQKGLQPPHRSRSPRRFCRVQPSSSGRMVDGTRLISDSLCQLTVL